LTNISLRIDSGEFLSIVGRSGSGKTTLMSILGLLDRPDTGSYFLNGREVAAIAEDRRAAIRNREIGFVFQAAALLPRSSALENVEMPLAYARVGPRERRRRAEAALDRVGLTDRAHHWPSQLSGGQQQRVAIARALVNDPALILADEPTGALDSKTAESVLSLFDELNRDGRTIVVVTHALDVAQRAPRRITLLDGRIIEDEREQVTRHSAQLLVADGSPSQRPVAAGRYERLRPTIGAVPMLVQRLAAAESYEDLHARRGLELNTIVREPRTIGAVPMLAHRFVSAFRATFNRELWGGLTAWRKIVAERLTALGPGSIGNFRTLMEKASVGPRDGETNPLPGAIAALQRPIASLAHEQYAPASLTLKEGLEELTGPLLLLQSCSHALRALGTNRLRSALTALGIVLGVGAVVCMVAVGEGARFQIGDQIAKLGTNLLFLQPYDPRHPLTEDDAAALSRDVPGVEISAPIIWGKITAVARDRHWSTTVWGNDSGYIVARDWPLAAGRLFNNDEIASGAKVAVIGQTIVEKLFDGHARIGATMRLENVPFTVVGVLEKKGEGGSGASQDDLVLIPLRAARSRVLGSSSGANPDADSAAESESDPTNEDGQQAKKTTDDTISYAHQANYQALDYLVLKYSPSSSEKHVRQAIEDVLARRHLASNPLDEFGIYDPADALATEEAAAKSFSWLIAAVASVSLAVGGISIMNTMLVSVTERTREIGLRMAVGARRRDIRDQFLVEAVLLAVLGALAGTFLGVFSATAIARFGGWPVFISTTIVLLACACTGLVGVVFGSLPAIRASRLDPMVALRTE
jgi:putative ABC transport system permease protein